MSRWLRWTLTDNSTSHLDNKGYTGHEMLDQVELVHMNGRIYDPITARFLSGDPLIQDPMNGQSYNRYSYVLNNPTNLTDPTGFSDAPIDKELKKSDTLTGSHLPGYEPGNLSCEGDCPTSRFGAGASAGASGRSQNEGAAAAKATKSGGIWQSIKDGYNSLTGANRETNCETLGCIHQGTGEATFVPSRTGDHMQDVVNDMRSQAAVGVWNAGREFFGWWKTATFLGLGAVGEGAPLAKEGLTLWPAASGGRTTINGIEYTVHALERMQPVGTIIKNGVMESRGLPVSVVENAIKFGKVSPGNTSAEVVRTFENVRVVTNPEGTRVITVIKKSN